MTHLLPALMLFLVGCGPTIRFEMMRAADVTIPPEVQTVAIIDRSGASNLGQGILGVLEGAITGEAIGADTEGRREAVRGLRQTLMTSPRYEVLQPGGVDAEQSLFDREMRWQVAKRICRQNGCDGIIALEAFDSDSSDDTDVQQVERTLDSGRKVQVPEYTVRRTTRVLAAWRFYDTDNERILDDLRDRTTRRTWTESGESRQDAIRRLPSQYDTVRSTAFESGVWYARRVAPSPIWVSRSIYGGGSPGMKMAKQYAKARDFEGAAEIWRGLRDDADPKVAGRALYNLAVYNEEAGRLDQAAVQARRAAVLLHDGRTRSYVVVIDQRIRDRDRLQEQLAPPPEPEPPVRRRPEPVDDGGMSRPR